MRPEVKKLLAFGSLPPEANASIEQLQKIETAFKSIERPITDEEATSLVEIFGVDGCFGLASSLMHLIETAPGWPVSSCLKNIENPWVFELRERAIRGGFTL